jgi:hypothetical protein
MSCSLVQRYRFGEKNLPRLYSTRQIETSGPSETFVSIYQSRLNAFRSVVLWHSNISMYTAFKHNESLLNSSMIATLWANMQHSMLNLIKVSCVLRQFSFMARQPPVGQGFPNVETSRSHSDIPPSIDLHRTKDKPYAEPSTSQHTKFTRHRRPYSRPDSNPQSQQTSGRGPTP